MKKTEDQQFVNQMLARFYDVGAVADGGVTRLGYSEAEDQMHEIFCQAARQMNVEVSADPLGNSYACMIPGRRDIVIGSHLDSVIQGGRYDGVAGVIAGLLVLRWAIRDQLTLPLCVTAFRCEESSNFGQATIGSGLLSGHLKWQQAADLKDQQGTALRDLFQVRGLRPVKMKKHQMQQYLELHIEQGRVLEEGGYEAGIVTTIAGPRRFWLNLTGIAEHSGATPMALRRDALCAAAEIVLAAERIGRREQKHASVAAVTVVKNQPNVMNVIPGVVQLGIDVRGIDIASLDRMEQQIRQQTAQICRQRGIRCQIIRYTRTDPVAMSRQTVSGLTKAARHLHRHVHQMPSGAGHDAMMFADLCQTGMVFIPCRKGLSHQPKESAQPRDIVSGAEILYEYLKESER